MNYLKAVWDDTSYRLVPMVSEDMWERFDRGPTRKVTISVASPATLPEIEDAGGAVADTFRTLGGAFEAPVIKLEMSMGQRKGALGGDIREAVLGLFGKHSDGEIDLRGLKAVAETNEGDPNDEIDLMNELLCERAELELPDNNPEVSYQIRKNFLRMAMRNNVR